MASRDVIHGNFSHFVVRPGDLTTLQIEPADIARFLSPTTRLNGFGLNGAAAALYNIFSDPYSPTKASAEACAIFSTYDLPRARYKSADSDLWHHLRPTKYWEKPVWLFPIHRLSQEHWVLAVVIPQAQQIYFFDSLGERGGWRKDLRVRLPLY
jgi:hypothetical protein